MKPRLTSISQLPTTPTLAREVVEFAGFSVLVWELTGREVQQWSKDNATIKGGKVVRLNVDTSTARLLVAALKDDHGRPQFSLADVNRLMEQGAADVARVDKVARRLSGLGDDEQDLGGDDSGDTAGEAGRGGNGYTPRTPSSTDSRSPSGDELAVNY